MVLPKRVGPLWGVGRSKFGRPENCGPTSCRQLALPSKPNFRVSLGTRTGPAGGKLFRLAAVRY